MATAEKVLDQTAGAQATLDTRKRLLAEAQQALAVAEQALIDSGTASAADLDALKTAKDNLATKRATLATAKQVQAGAQADLTKVKDAIKAAQATLATAQTALETATKELEAAKASLNRLQNLPQLLKAAEDRVAAAKAVAADMAKAYKEAVAKLEALKALLPKEVAPKPIPQPVAKPGSQQSGKSSVLGATPRRQAVKKQAAGIAPVSPTGKAATAQAATTGCRSDNHQSLPQTGDGLSVLSSLGASLLGLAGFLGRKRQK